MDRIDRMDRARPSSLTSATSTRRPWIALGTVVVALGWGPTALAAGPDTKVKVGKGGVTVETGKTKVDVQGAKVQVEAEDTDDGDGDEGGDGEAESASVTGGDAEALSIAGKGKKLTHTCGGEANGATAVELTGEGHEVVLLGACARVSITGTNIVVRADRVGAIDATGNKISVTWKKALKGATPAINKTGNAITITRVDK